MNPYTHQVYLFVPNAEKAAMGQFMRDNGDQLASFAFGDPEMAACSGDGQGPPGGWAFASWVTAAQAAAFTAATWPAGVVIAAHQIGLGPHFDAWLGALVTPMQRIIEEIP